MWVIASHVWCQVTLTDALGVAPLDMIQFSFEAKLSTTSYIMAIKLIIIYENSGLNMFSLKITLLFFPPLYDYVI